MITLEIEKYCNNCPNFDVETEKHMLNVDGRPLEYYTYVKCKNREMCRNIKKYLESEIKKND